MTKDLLLQLDGSAADDLRLAAVDNLAQMFEAHVRGLFMNLLPPRGDPARGGIRWGRRVSRAAGARPAERRPDRSRPRPFSRPAGQIRRDPALRRLCRSSLGHRRPRSPIVRRVCRPTRPGSIGSSECGNNLVEAILFGSGRYVVLVAGPVPQRFCIERVIVAWNESREAARAVSEVMPYLRGARDVRIPSRRLGSACRCAR